jgi:hypothetical protein
MSHGGGGVTVGFNVGVTGTTVVIVTGGIVVADTDGVVSMGNVVLLHAVVSHSYWLSMHWHTSHSDSCTTDPG